MWGVTVNRDRYGNDHLESVEFTVTLKDNEDYIVRRLMREKRVGKVEKIDDNAYRFSALLYNTAEMIPWIRTFICRITEIHFSNKNVEKHFRSDLAQMYRMYGIKEDEL